MPQKFLVVLQLQPTTSQEMLVMQHITFESSLTCSFIACIVIITLHTGLQYIIEFKSLKERREMGQKEKEIEN